MKWSALDHESLQVSQLFVGLGTNELGVSYEAKRYTVLLHRV